MTEGIAEQFFIHHSEFLNSEFTKSAPNPGVAALRSNAERTIENEETTAAIAEQFFIRHRGRASNPMERPLQ